MQTSASTPSRPAPFANPLRDEPVSPARRQRNRVRRTPCPPCPELPRHLTGNNVEQVVMARVQRAGRRYQQNFSLRHYGSWEKAAEAAASWLAQLQLRLPLRFESQSRPSPRNRSGMVGVHYRAGRRVLRCGDPVEYPSYVSRWPGAKAGVRWMFSTHRGEENAFLLACISREIRSADRIKVAQAVRKLSPERRRALLAQRSAIPSAEPVAKAALAA